MAEKDRPVQSETFLYPFFPYYPDDQMLLKAPDYRRIADDIAEICHGEELISGYSWEEEGVHEVMYIHFLDGEVMRLSDMQAMLVLQGVLKGFKRLREKELKIKPQFDVLNNLKKKPRSRETQFVELDFPAKTKRKSRKKNDIAQTLAEKSAETSAGISAKEIRERFLKEKEEDDSWMDDILGD